MASAGAKDRDERTIQWGLPTRRVAITQRSGLGRSFSKNRFSEVVEAARRLPQTVTKHGKPAVVVVDVTEYERLRRLDRVQAPSFAELLLAMPQDGGEFPRLKARPHDAPTSKEIGVSPAARPRSQAGSNSGQP